MYFIKLLNKDGESFVKKYNSYYLYNKDFKKYKHSTKLKIISYGKI